MTTLRLSRFPSGLVRGTSAVDGMFFKENPVQISGLAATLFHKLGIDQRKEFVSNIGRRFRIPGANPHRFFL